MSDEKKPREFWIYKDELGSQIYDSYLADAAYIHTIEYSAYKKLEAKLQVANKKLEIAVSALKFYTQPRRDTSFDGWQSTYRFIEIKDESDYEFYPNHYSAIDAIEEIESLDKAKETMETSKVLDEDGDR